MPGVCDISCRGTLSTARLVAGHMCDSRPFTDYREEPEVVSMSAADIVVGILMIVTVGGVLIWYLGQVRARKH